MVTTACYKYARFQIIGDKKYCVFIAKYNVLKMAADDKHGYSFSGDWTFFVNILKSWISKDFLTQAIQAKLSQFASF